MQQQFTFPAVLDGEAHRMQIEELYHPLVKGAVGNSIAITPEKNIIFLTGANMAGKSTFMKSLGVAVLLAHMGFPVAAAAMEFSVRDGIYSSINVPDDLKNGYSHFYAEVLRVKNVAEQVSTGKNLVIIFDELFKGTNVKDAYEATLAVSEAFAANRNCGFIISTHITEAGEELKNKNAGIQFFYLPTIINGTIPAYTYQLQEGSQPTDMG